MAEFSRRISRVWPPGTLVTGYLPPPHMKIHGMPAHRQHLFEITSFVESPSQWNVIEQKWYQDPPRQQCRCIIDETKFWMHPEWLSVAATPQDMRNLLRYLLAECQKYERAVEEVERWEKLLTSQR